LTLGTKARIMAKHALVRAQEAVDEGNKILEAEVSNYVPNTHTNSRIPNPSSP